MGLLLPDALPVLLLSTLLSPVAFCQNSTECTHGSILPNNFSPTKFYVCYDGELRSQDCPMGMRFDPVQRYCSVGNVGGANCGDTPNGGFTAAQNNPDKYYVCTNGELVLQLCPSMQTFNPSLGYCTQGGIGPPLPPPPPPPPPTPNLNCGQFPQGSFIGDIVEKSKYYICVLGELRPQYCPEGKVFDKELLACINGPSSQQPDACGPYPPGSKIPDCQNMENYLTCTLGVFLIHKCSAGTLFDKTLRECSSSVTNATTTSSPPVTNAISCPTGTVPDATRSFCVNPLADITGLYGADPSNPANYYAAAPPANSIPCPTGSLFFPALSDNTPPCAPVPLPQCPPGPSYAIIELQLPTMQPQPPAPGFTPYYIVCNNGSQTVQRCPKNSIMYEGQCLQLARSIARSSKNFDHKTSNGYKKQMICNKENHGKYTAKENDCQKFYLCLNHELIEHSCPHGQYFDPDENVCKMNRGECIVNAENYFSASHRQKRSRKQARNDESVDCFGKHGVFTPDPYDCKRFYACINGWKIAQQCDEYETYDPETQSCISDPDNICSSQKAINLFIDSIQQIEKQVEEEYSMPEVSCAGHELGEFLPNEEDCASYYVCSNGFSIPKQCPPEHYFDQNKLICSPSDGKCGEAREQVDPLDLPIYLASNDNNSICTGKHGIIVPDPDDCTSFYLCIYGRAHHDRCYEGEYFDSIQRHCTKNLGKCTYAEQNEQKVDQTQNLEEKPLSNVCNGYFDGTHLPNPNDCTNFFVCIDGIPIPETCAENEFFDSIHGFCRVNQNGAESCSASVSDRSICYGKHGVHIEHPDDCRKYYLCVNGQALVHDCNINEYFNTRMGSCILDVEGTCPLTKTEEASQPEKTDLGFDMEHQNHQELPQHEQHEHFYLGIHNDLSSAELYKYTEYENSYGKPIYQKPALHVYKPETPKKKLPKCSPGMNQYMFYPNVADECRTFYECLNGKPIIHSCPIGFVYNAILNICDVPDFVECTHTMNIRDPRDWSCEGAISGVRYANFENGCKSFYVCSHGSAVQTFCGEGLLYNPLMGVCDWEANIECYGAKERKAW